MLDVKMRLAVPSHVPSIDQLLAAAVAAVLRRRAPGGLRDHGVQDSGQIYRQGVSSSGLFRKYALHQHQNYDLW
jgi:hypothetical protein